MRKSFTKDFKAKVAVKAFKADETMAELSSKYEVHRAQITRWKKEALDGIPEIFASKRSRKSDNDSQLTDELYKQIGKLKVENDWLKKKIDAIDS